MDTSRDKEFKILIVDDSDFSRSTINKMLQETNYKVVAEAASAKEAMALLGSRSIDIAIIDVVMPEISGIELAEAINQNFNQIEILIISSLAHENIVIEAINHGANDFIQKPFSSVDLINSLDKIASEIERKKS
jgi:two-component system chemotaxis response regulator CheY